MATAKKAEQATRPMRCMKCGKLFETNLTKCPYCGGKLTENKPENKKQYLAD